LYYGDNGVTKMIEATIQSRPCTRGTSSYFRRLFEARPELLEARRNEELLAHWLRDHPEHPIVPAEVKRSLANLKSFLRKKQRQASQNDVASTTERIQRRPTGLNLEHRANRGKETIHDYAEPLPQGSRETMHDAPRTKSRWEAIQRPFPGFQRETPYDVSAIPIRQGLAKADPRQEPRLPVRVPVIAVPVLPDGAPDWDHRVTGKSSDFSSAGMGMVIDSAVELSTSSLVLLLQQPDGSLCCGGLEVLHNTTIAQGARLGGRFGGFADQLLRPESLTPAFQPMSLAFALPFPEEVLDKWAQIGVLQPYLWDRVALCPKCRGLPTFRDACANCGSVSLTTEKLIHHFACAHMDHADTFGDQEDLVCPKCRQSALVIGADYEYVTGPYRCQDCHWTNMELEHVAQCLKCRLRFPGYQAYEQDLRGYRAHRLDPLAFLPASRPAAGLSGGAAADGRTSLRA
jgi:hypothetical protein